MPRQHYSVSDYAHWNEEAPIIHYLETRNDDFYYEDEFEDFDCD